MLGAGSSGVVRKMRHLPTGRLICLKVRIGYMTYTLNLYPYTPHIAGRGDGTCHHLAEL